MRLLLRIAAPLPYLIVAIWAIVLSIREPVHNWDTIPYVGAAKALEESDPSALQAFTYGELRHVLPTAVYGDLARETGPGEGRGGPYRHAVSTDPAVFDEMLPSYRIRPLYIGAVYALYKGGMDIEFATRFVAAVGVAAGMMFMFLLASRVLAAPLVYLVPLLAVNFGVLLLARFSTPDGLAFCAWMLCAWLYARGSHTALLIVLPVVIAVRNDLALFTLPLYAALWLLDRPQRRTIALSLTASLVLNYALIVYWPHPPWTNIFSCTLLTAIRCVHPATDPPPLSVADYLIALHTGATKLLVDTDFLTCIAVLALAAYLIWRRARRTSTRAALTHPASVWLVVCTLFMAGRWLVLPAEWERAFPAPYVLCAIGVLWLLSTRESNLSAAPARA